MNAVQPPRLYTPTEAADLIRSGTPLSIAGPERILDGLPAGNWIGGTTYYFMLPTGGMHTTEHVMATILGTPDSVHFRIYGVENLDNILNEAPANGYTRVVVPDNSQVLRCFAERSRFWPGSFLKPIIGWVSGVDLQAADPGRSQVYQGSSGFKSSEHLVAAHVTLPPERVATIQSINIFEPDRSHVLRFSTTGYEIGECSVDGRTTRLSDFLAEQGNREGKLPLMGDYAGALVNVSVKSIDWDSGKVLLYAPVFPDVEYHLALPVGNYVERFAQLLASHGGDHPSFTCNCILNYLHGNLEGQPTGGLTGPITFGEIGYILHNQTMALLEIH
jgi:hypothetical protein